MLDLAASLARRQYAPILVTRGRRVGLVEELAVSPTDHILKRASSRIGIQPAGADEHEPAVTILERDAHIRACQLISQTKALSSLLREAAQTRIKS